MNSTHARLRTLLQLALATASFMVAASCEFRHAGAQSNQVKVMSFNVLHGGTQQEIDVLSTLGADIIGVQEGDSEAAVIASALGFNHATLPGGVAGYECDVITRFPITATYNHGVKVDMGPLGDGYIFVAHLIAYPYQPYQLHPHAVQLNGGPPINTGTQAGDAAAARSGATATRGSQLAAIMNNLAANAPAGAPVFLVGDFNEPSHLDWTPEAGPGGGALHTHAVAWPASETVANAGFADSYRQLFPDETVQLGYTWTTNENNPEVHDRIDFVYYKGAGVLPTDVKLVGAARSAGGVSADIQYRSWPSDHRAVLTTFEIVPEPSAMLLAAFGTLVLMYVTPRSADLSAQPTAAHAL